MNPCSRGHRPSVGKGSSHTQIRKEGPKGPALGGRSAGEIQLMSQTAERGAPLLKAAGEGWLAQCKAWEKASFLSLCEGSVSAGRTEGVGGRAGRNLGLRGREGAGLAFRRTVCVCSARTPLPHCPCLCLGGGSTQLWRAAEVGHFSVAPLRISFQLENVKNYLSQMQHYPQSFTLSLQ